MSIRLQLILFVVVGYLLMAVVFFFSTETRDDIKDDAANESLVILYESAWYQTYNSTYEVMSKWMPGTGDKGNFWDPDEEGPLNVPTISCHVEPSVLCWTLNVLTY